MISRFFIDRPIFANVIAIVTMIFGLVTLRSLAGRAVPADHAADRAGLDVLSRAPNAQVVADYRRRADRAAGERRRGHALHVVDLRERRLVCADGHVRHRHEPRHRPGARAEPRGDRRSRSCPTRSSDKASRSRSSRPTSSCSWRSPRRRGVTTACTSRTTRTLRIRDELSRIDGVGDVSVVRRGLPTACASGSIRPA